jgi:hypothetical protein
LDDCKLISSYELYLLRTLIDFDKLLNEISCQLKLDPLEKDIHLEIRMSQCGASIPLDAVIKCFNSKHAIIT